MNSEDNNTKARKLLISLLRSGKTVDVPAQGLSMFPVLLPGDMLRVIPAKPADLKRGMIVVYESEDKIISHRFIKIRESKLICKGDGLRSYDSPFPTDRLLGIVTARTRNGILTHLTNRLRRTTGTCMSYITPITGYLFYYLRYLWYKLKHEN